jgi:hypothetical protein
MKMASKGIKKYAPAILNSSDQKEIKICSGEVKNYDHSTGKIFLFSNSSQHLFNMKTCEIFWER